jgi:hypothetical protein
VHSVAFVYTSLSFTVSTQRQNSPTFTVYNEFIGLMVFLHVSAYEAIIRQYTLTFIQELLNCVLFKFIYYNITITNVPDYLPS